jgi:helix-turn-helix protein
MRKDEAATGLKEITVPVEDELLTVKDIQRICKIGRTHAYALTNELNPIRINSVLRVRRSALEQYLRNHERTHENRW